MFYDAQACRERLKNTTPMVLIDKAQKISDTQFAGYKCVTQNELFFIGHFPEHPIMPGVLQIEAMKQLAQLFLADRFGGAMQIVKLSRVKFRNPVSPGARMKISLEITEETAENITAKAKVEIALGVASEATLTFGAMQTAEADNSIPEHNEFDLTNDAALNHQDTMSLMPHRFPFLLIDYVSKNDGETVVGVKNVSINEPIFANMTDPVMPISLLCEIAAQSGCACVLSRPENEGKLGYFMSIDQAEALAPVRPGDQLLINFSLPQGKSRFGKGSGFMTVNGKKVFTITLTFALVDK